MNEKESFKSNSQTIFDRLDSRGIDYGEIKKLVSLDLPHALWYFETHFGPHTPPQVLRQAKRWRRLLSDDFLVLAEQTREIERTISGAEMFAWNALIAVSFPKLGSWNLSCEVMPTRQDPGPRANQPEIQIVAIHEKTGETRVAVVPGSKNSVVAGGHGWRKAFADLGLLALVLRPPLRKRLVSARHAQAWPIFTQVVIPRLYDFLAPFYRKRGHVREKELVLTRDAFFSNELLEDMREILRQEHPYAFEAITRDQLKAAVQRHVTHLRKSTESAK